jgi:hypothetical protein
MYTYRCGCCKKKLPRIAYHKDSSSKGHFSICKTYRAQHRRSVIREMLSNAKSRARRNGLEFDLSLDFLKQLNASQDGRCAYSGILLNWALDSRGIQRTCPPDRASLDRIDPNKGYTQDNVHLVLDLVNRIKSAYSEQKFLEICCAIADHIRQSKAATLTTISI